MVLEAFRTILAHAKSCLEGASSGCERLRDVLEWLRGGVPKNLGVLENSGARWEAFPRHAEVLKSSSQQLRGCSEEFRAAVWSHPEATEEPRGYFVG